MPVGSYRKNTLGYVQPNDAYRGLQRSQLTSMDSYMHLRSLEQKDKVDLCAREADIFTEAFTDAVKWRELRDLVMVVDVDDYCADFKDVGTCL